MRHIVLFLAFFVFDVAAYGQSNSLHCYIEADKRNSPLLNDYRNQMQIEQDELQRLKAMYRHSLLDVNGDYLFVPIVSKDGGGPLFSGTHATLRIIMGMTLVKVADSSTPE